MILSVLIASIPSRFESMIKLYNKIQEQAKGYDIEILAFIDNKKRSIGYKRNDLVQLAKGKYQVQIDDDDDVEENFIEEIMKVISNTDYDLITFNQYVTLNNENKFTVRFAIENENEEIKKVDGLWVDIKRKPFHNMVWKSEIAKSEQFSNSNGGEDWDWTKRLIPKVRTVYNIDKPLTIYIYNKNVTEANGEVYN